MLKPGEDSASCIEDVLDGPSLGLPSSAVGIVMTTPFPAWLGEDSLLVEPAESLRSSACSPNELLVYILPDVDPP